MSPYWTRPTIVASNRGPLAFELDEEGTLVPTKTSGGLASGLRPLLDGRTQIGTSYWFANPMSDADRAAKQAGLFRSESGSLNVEITDASSDLLRAAVGRFANERLWFLLHDLVGVANLGDEMAGDTQPSIDTDFQAFVAMNDLLADTIIEVAPANSLLLVQDYHLPMVAERVHNRRPDIDSVHFSHTPFASPVAFAALPRPIAKQILSSMASHRSCGFHSQRWARQFEACCEAFGVVTPTTFVSPLPPDRDRVTAMAARATVTERRAAIRRRHRDRKLIVRVDRLEPTKNIVAGFDAFDRLLASEPNLSGRVVFMAFVYPSRSELDVYRRLRTQVITAVDRINDRWATSTWQPIELNLADDLEAAMAGLCEYDVLVVNPLSDGLNLVALEGPIVNERNGAIVLSQQAGAHDQLGSHVESVDPLEIEETAMAIERALNSNNAVRERQRNAQFKAATERTIEDWYADQVASTL